MQRVWLWSAIIVIATVLTFWTCFRYLGSASTDAPADSVNVKIQLDGTRDHANLIENSDGSHSYLLTRYDGSTESLSPEQFADRLYRQQKSRSFLAVVFNISHPIGILWVSIGLLGQVLFTGRMIMQWLASEKNKKSVVPPIFWWLSMIGSLMLLSYFTWRRDIVGILGQGFGLAIYFRNLHMIYFPQRRIQPDPVAPNAAPQTQAAHS